jgi:predicted nucleic acid-binding protein
VAYILDTTALIAYFKAEASGPLVRDMLLEQPTNLLLPFMAIMEAQYVLARAFAPPQVEQFIATLRGIGAPIIESTPAWGAAAAQLKARGGLSLADAWIASLALMHDAELVHNDPEFDRVEGLRSLRLR